MNNHTPVKCFLRFAGALRAIVGIEADRVGRKWVQALREEVTRCVLQGERGTVA